MTTIDSLLHACEVPGIPRVYILGCWERNVSIYLQQVRGLNLAWALHAGRRLHSGDRVAVVGGGFAGLSVAAGLQRLGHTVTVLERQSRLLPWQQGNLTRWIHPHIHDWPRPGSLDVDAHLPLLNWQADLAGPVATTVLQQLEDLHVPVECGAPEFSLSSDDTGGTILGRRFEHIILALGLGVERSFGQLPLNSYWADDSVSTVQTGVRRYLVSGIGEGGVIDTLYLTLSGFSHMRVARECIRDAAELESRLLDIESSLDDDTAPDWLTLQYQALSVPAAIDTALRQQIRSDTAVTLNGGTGYLSAKADILNRFLLSRLVHMGVVRYLPGRLTDVQYANDVFRVTIDGDIETYDRVLIRHGTVPTLKTQFPDLWTPYHERHPRPDPAPVYARWTERFFDA